MYVKLFALSILLMIVLSLYRVLAVLSVLDLVFIMLNVG